MALKPEVRNNIFNKLKTSLQKQCPPMKTAKDTSDEFEIIGNTPVPYGSTKKIIPGMFFSSTIARKDMVSFYFFPAYYNRKEFSRVAPNLMKQLKGKTCFNFKKAEHVVEKELDALLSMGAEIWRKRGYVK